MAVYIGCPVWGYKEWIGSFFPDRTPASDFLRLYSQRLTAVEGNTTFYALPSRETVLRWQQETPETFRLCPKISRAISHAPALAMSAAKTHAFIERLQGLASRLGPMFLQLPPTFSPAQLTQLQTFLDFWPTSVRLAVEVRHPDFYQEPEMTALNTLLRQYDVARVIMDTRPMRVGSADEQRMLQARERKPNLPLHITTTTDFAFVRYIGHPRLQANAPFLEQWAQWLAEWFTQGLTLYIFCHCPFEEHSPRLCATLYQRLQTLVPLPPLPWSPKGDDTQPQQARLF